jgi:hypothetical protein
MNYATYLLVGVVKRQAKTDKAGFEQKDIRSPTLENLSFLVELR